MKLIETHLEGKQINQDSCEDGLFISKDFIAVIDGVTSKGSQLWDGLTSGSYAKKIICNELSLVAPEITANDLINRLNRSLNIAYLNRVKRDAVEEWLRACIIIYSDYYHEIWSYGDCHCIINDDYYSNSKKVDTITSEARCLALNYALLNGATISQLQENDIGREVILPLLNMQLLFENQNGEYGYPVLNGHNLNLDYLQTYSVNLSDVIVLASDGYPYLMPTLSDSETKLHSLLKEDPLCFQIYKSTKGLVLGNHSFDDRCYCKFLVD